MTSIDTLLKSADPGASTPDYTQAERSDILTRSIQQASPKHRRIGGRVAAVAAVTLAVIGIGASNLAAPSISAHAEEILTQAAINATDPDTRPGQYWRIDTTATQTAGFVDEGPQAVCSRTQQRTEYVSVDGTTPTWFVAETSWVAGEDADPLCLELEGETSSWTTDLAPNEFPDSWQAPSPGFLASLPRDVSQLRDRVYADSEGQGRDPDSEAFVHVADMLRSGLVPADLRSSLFGVLKTLPGIDVVDEALIDGRTVVMLAIDDIYGQTEQLIVDPEGGQVIGERDLAADGTVGFESRTTRELVDEIPAGIRASAEFESCTTDDGGSVVCG